MKIKWNKEQIIRKLRKMNTKNKGFEKKNLKKNWT